MKKYVPNFLTLGRLVLVPPIVILLFFPGKFWSALAAFIFLIASLTGFFRWVYRSTVPGRVLLWTIPLDPIRSYKVLVTFLALIMLIALGRVQAWVVMLIITREVAVSALRSITKSWDTTLKPSPVGKLKTVFQFTAIVPLMIHYTYDIGIPIDFHMIGTVLLYIALVLTIWSGIDYFYRFYKEYEIREDGEAL